MSEEIGIALLVVLVLSCVVGASVVVEQRRLQKQLEHIRRLIEELRLS